MNIHEILWWRHIAWRSIGGWATLRHFSPRCRRSRQLPIMAALSLIFGQIESVNLLTGLSWSLYAGLRDCTAEYLQFPPKWPGRSSIRDRNINKWLFYSCTVSFHQLGAKCYSCYANSQSFGRPRNSWKSDPERWRLSPLYISFQWANIWHWGESHGCSALQFTGLSLFEALQAICDAALFLGVNTTFYFWSVNSVCTTYMHHVRAFDCYSNEKPLCTPKWMYRPTLETPCAEDSNGVYEVHSKQYKIGIWHWRPPGASANTARGSV